MYIIIPLSEIKLEIAEMNSNLDSFDLPFPNVMYFEIPGLKVYEKIWCLELKFTLNCCNFFIFYRSILII